MRRRKYIGNRVYQVILLSLPLTAARSDQLTGGPFLANAVVPLPANKQGGNPFFQFFNQGEQKHLTLETAAVNIESLPLPDLNKPANFTGAIGDFTITATASPTKVTIGDPIIVRVQISGSGTLDSVTLPTQDTWRDFNTYPPTTRLDVSDQFSFQGTKTFEQIVSAKNKHVHKLPALTFSFFNPNDGRYHTLTQTAMPMVIILSGATPSN